MSRPLVILGGCGGIGRNLVARATAAGWDPIVMDLPASIEAHPLDCTCLPVDATDTASLATAAETCSNVGGFVNLCGFMTDAEPLSTQGRETWNALIDGNLTSAFLAASALAPRMTEGSAMVLTGSGLGHFARPGYGGYAIAKAGIAAMTRQLALELAPKTRVNCVAPAAVDTAFLRGGTGRSDEAAPERLDRAAYAATIPLGRMAEPHDVTGPILFLLGLDAGFITGQTLHINGGAFMP